MLKVRRRAQRTECDLLVVGGGVAGFYAALCAANEADVVVLTKGPIKTTASYLAQGGVAAAVGADDDPALHAEDTIAVGRGLSRPSAVSGLAREAAARLACGRRGDRAPDRARTRRARRRPPPDLGPRGRTGARALVDRLALCW